MGTLEPIELEFNDTKPKMLKIQFGNVSMEISEAVSVTTPDGKVINIYDVGDKWVVAVG